MVKRKTGGGKQRKIAPKEAETVYAVESGPEHRENHWSLGSLGYISGMESSSDPTLYLPGFGVPPEEDVGLSASNSGSIQVAGRSGPKSSAKRATVKPSRRK